MDQTSLGQALADGAVDLAVGSFPRLPATLIQRRLFDRHFVAVVSRTHALASQRLGVRRFAETPQLVVHGNSGVQDTITELLAAQQLQRAELLELPSYLMVRNLDGLGPSIRSSIRLRDLWIVLPSVCFAVCYPFLSRYDSKGGGKRFRIVWCAGCLLFIAARGPGLISLDALVAKWTRRQVSATDPDASGGASLGQSTVHSRGL